ncbi:MAG: hypothetical protein Q9221_006757, partial [Calogaya cf. arnoldii]
LLKQPYLGHTAWGSAYSYRTLDEGINGNFDLTPAQLEEMAAVIKEKNKAYQNEFASAEFTPSTPYPSKRKQIVAVLEAERAAAVSEGKQGDWWQGPSRKGVSPAKAQALRTARAMATAEAQGKTELMGLGTEEDQDKEAGIGAFLALGPNGFSSNCYLEDDGDRSDYQET